MGTFSEKLAEFDKSLETVKAKKTDLDKAQDSLNNASMAYNNAVDTAQKLRSDINTALGEVLPTSDRIRVSN